MQYGRSGRSRTYSRYDQRTEYAPRTRARRSFPLAVLLALDLLGVAVVMGVFCLFFFLVPRSIPTQPISLPGTVSSQSTDGGASSTAQPGDTAAAGASDALSTSPPAGAPSSDQGMWGAKFADKFATGDPEITDTSYKSKDISVTITKNQQNSITWYVADIYVRNLQNFRTALAQDQYGKGITEPTLDMANRANAIVAVSGDFYGNHETGIVVRNGKLYRQTALDDVLIMNNDGSMQTFDNQSFQPSAVVKNGAWQAWTFGPMLLDNGQPMTKFNSKLNPANPRAAIGYYEPGHYCLVVVDGRQPGYSNGIGLKDFSQLFHDMGCKVAYNLDGGQTAVMTFMGKWVNQPYNNGRNCSDIVYIGENTNGKAVQ